MARVDSRRFGTWVRRHPHHAAVASITAGLAVSPAPSALPHAALGIGIVAVLVVRVPTLALAGVALVLLGGAVGTARLSAIDHPDLRLRAGARIEARVLLLERPRATAAPGSGAAVRIVAGTGRGGRVLARTDSGLRWPAGIEPGMELAVRGTLATARSGRLSNFDYAAHLRRRGISAELALDTVRLTGGRRGGVAGALDAARRRAERGIAGGLGERHAALARGMVLGQDEEIAAPVREDFRASGLGHLLAVSGQNVMLLGALALPLLAAAGVGVRGRIFGVLALIALYVPLAGAGPSLQRAGVMGAAGLAALAASRPSSRVYALLLAAAATLAVNPRVSGDPGWQLSFAAVAGILGIGPGLRPRLRAFPRIVAEGVALTVAATLATGPLLAHHFGSIPLAGLPANLLAMPAVAPSMWIGMVQAGLAQLTLAGGVPGAAATGLADALAGLNGPLLEYLSRLARGFADLPGAELELPRPSLVAVGAAYAGLAALVLAASRARAVAERWALPAAAAWRRVPRRRRWVVVVVLLAVLAMGLRQAVSAPGPPGRLTVSFLDVGQGDATLAQHPDGGAVLFDGGPREARVARLLRRAGVERLSAVVATHASADHHGGLVEVLERFPVDLLIDGGDGTADPDFNAVLAEADRRGVRRVRAVAGTTLRAGGLTVRVLSPPPRPPGVAPADPNPRAVVAIVSADEFDLFLSGDAESPALASLPLPDVEALKVPHHGSSDPGLPGILDRLRPELAVIEVGSENRFGHPAPDTLAALIARVPRVHRTDRDGTVSVTVDSGAFAVATER